MRTGFDNFSDDDLRHAIDHGWECHDPDLSTVSGTKHPAGTTHDATVAIFWEIAGREWVEAPVGPLDPELRARLDAGEVTLVECRGNHLNLFGRIGNVRYEIRLAGRKSTAHPIDGDGVVRHKNRRGAIIEVELPLGSRPVSGWDAERKLR